MHTEYIRKGVVASSQAWAETALACVLIDREYMIDRLRNPSGYDFAVTVMDHDRVVASAIYEDEGYELSMAIHLYIKPAFYKRQSDHRFVAAGLFVSDLVTPIPLIVARVPKSRPRVGQRLRRIGFVRLHRELQDHYAYVASPKDVREAILKGGYNVSGLPPRDGIFQG